MTKKEMFERTLVAMRQARINSEFIEFIEHEYNNHINVLKSGKKRVCKTQEKSRALGQEIYKFMSYTRAMTSAEIAHRMTLDGYKCANGKELTGRSLNFALQDLEQDGKIESGEMYIKNIGMRKIYRKVNDD